MTRRGEACDLGQSKRVLLGLCSYSSGVPSTERDFVAWMGPTEIPKESRKFINFGIRGIDVSN